MSSFKGRIDDLVKARESRFRELTAVVDRAESESRSLNPAEQAEFSSIEAALTSLDESIATLSASEARSAQIAGNPVISGLYGRESSNGAPQGENRAGNWLAGELRGLTGASGAGAAFTPAENSATFIDLLSAQSVFLASGVQQITTDRDSLVIPRLTADTTSGWFSEGDTISSSDLAGDSVTAIPRKLAALQTITSEVLADSFPSILQITAQSMVRSIGLKLDLGAFEGSGTAPEVRGLKNVSGIGSISMGTDGAAFASLDHFADAIGQIEAANAHAGAIVMHPTVWTSLSKLKELASGSNKPLLQESAGSGSQGLQRSIYGVPVYLSSQLSVTETQGASSLAASVYVYDPTTLFFVRRTEVQVVQNPYSKFAQDSTDVRAIVRADIVAAHAPAIVRIKGVLTA